MSIGLHLWSSNCILISFSAASWYRKLDLNCELHRSQTANLYSPFSIIRKRLATGRDTGPRCFMESIPVNPSFIDPMAQRWSSDGKWTRSVVALTCNLDLLGPRFFTGFTAVFVASLHRAPTRQVRALVLVNRCHYCSPFSFLVRKRHQATKSISRQASVLSEIDFLNPPGSLSGDAECVSPDRFR
jgi:hypothetical protein